MSLPAVDSKGGESLSIADDDDSHSEFLVDDGAAVTRDALGCDADVVDWKMTLSALSDVLLFDSSPNPLLMLLLLFSLVGRPTDADRCIAAWPLIAGDGGAVTLTGVVGCPTGICRRRSTSGLSPLVVAGTDSLGDVGGGGGALSETPAAG